MKHLIFRVRQFVDFYWAAVTKYQLHSPFVFQLAEAVLESRHWYYAFYEIEKLRHQMVRSRITLEVTDFGTGKGGLVALKTLASRAASSVEQGRRLFRVANWASPQTMLEMGSSVGIGTAYLYAGARPAKVISLEGCPAIANVAQANMELLGFPNKVDFRVGPFEKTLENALSDLQHIDFVYFDGNHRKAPTLEYFEKCLEYAHEKSVFVFDDIHWSPEMKEAWSIIQQHPRVTLTVDFFDISLVFINPDFKVKQHFRIVPSRWKIWKFL